MLKSLITGTALLSVVCAMVACSSSRNDSPQAQNKAADTQPVQPVQPGQPAARVVSAAEREAMVRALRYGDLREAKRLRQSGVSYDVLASDNMTGLMRLADDGDLEGVRMLIAVGANINAVNLSGESAIWYAAYSGHGHVALELLTMGANPKGQRAETKECLLHIAAQSGLSRLAAKLVTKTPECLAQKDIDGRTPSAVAKSLGYSKLAKTLAPPKQR